MSARMKLVAGVSVLSFLLAMAPAFAQSTGSISGVVTNESGTVLADVKVTAFYTGGGTVRSSLTAADGTYRIDQLISGGYTVFFEDASSEPVYLSEWWNDKPDQESSDSVYMGAGQQVSPIDGQLSLGGGIGGTVISEEGDPLVNAYVAFYTESGTNLGIARTNAAGSYRSGTLAPGSYKVGFSDYGFIDQYFLGKNDLSSANLVEVLAGSTTAGIDAVMIQVSPPPPPPLRDLALTSFSVQDATVQEDVANIFDRTVQATIRNDGEIDELSAGINLYSCGQTTGACAYAATGNFQFDPPLRPGENRSVWMKWNAAGSAGDIRINAELALPWALESRYDNNYASASTHVFVQGTGQGVGPGDIPGIPCVLCFVPWPV